MHKNKRLQVRGRGRPRDVNKKSGISWIVVGSFQQLILVKQKIRL